MNFGTMALYQAATQNTPLLSAGLGYGCY